ncbi:hypothetical protein MAR_022014 [Mya arenaria]|uniref:Uncharacterized protein n=1 Tax=Mya arenaria TaxID=6604 RepID=A0ABY7E9W6_MYAAR|nr:hypothetical protein MAR_022014 [Mya arenaria]
MESDPLSTKYYDRFLEQLRRYLSRPASRLLSARSRKHSVPETPPERRPLTTSTAAPQSPVPQIHVSDYSEEPEMERRRVAEIEGIDSSKMRQFPFSSFKLLGGLQIGVGIVCLLLGLVDLFVFLYVSEYDSETLTALTIACTPVWCGLWKMTFMILSVMCALLFAPALFGIERKEGDWTTSAEWLIPMVIAFFAFNEIICAVITAAICCCCSPLNQAKVRVLYTRELDELHEHPEKRRLETPEIFYTDNSRLERSRHSPRVYSSRKEQPAIAYGNWDDQHGNSHMRTPRQVELVHQSHQPHPAAQHQRQEVPRASMHETDSPVAHYSRPPTYEGHPNNDINSYRRLRQLTLPGVGTA